MTAGDAFKSTRRRGETVRAPAVTGRRAKCRVVLQFTSAAGRDTFAASQRTREDRPVRAALYQTASCHNAQSNPIMPMALA